MRTPVEDLSADVVVVGGGIAGVTTALRLARAGTDVVLLEAGELGAAASGANAGSLHGQVQYAPFRDRGEAWAEEWAPSLGLLQRSLELWRGLGDEVGADLEAATLGGVLVAADEEQLRRIERKVALENRHGIASVVLDRDDLRRVAPYVSEQMVGGELCPIEGKANPLLATQAIARAAREAGARIHTRRPVSHLERDGGGLAAVTERGTYRAPKVVLCGGSRTAALAGTLGVDLPVEEHPMQVNVTEAIAPLVSHLVYYAGGALTLKQARSGSVLIGGGWPAGRDRRTGRSTVDAAGVARNLAVACEVVPALGSVRLLRTWTGPNNAVVDERPIIGAVPSVPGLVVGTWPYLGFSGGPGLGELLARLARDEDPGHDLRPFAPERFASSGALATAAASR